jgi:flagellar biosynthetic protein FlhB
MPEGEDKSFPATQRRREQARKEGNVARSPEFGAAATLLAMVVALHAALPGSVGMSLLDDFHVAFRFNVDELNFNIGTAHTWQVQVLYWAGRIIIPALVLAVVLGVAVNIGQVGFHVTPEALSPKWDRINPLSGFKRLFSMHGTVEVVKGIAKMAIIGGICYSTVRDAIDGGLLGIAGATLGASMSAVGSLLWLIGIRVSVALLILAVADYAYQRYDYEKNLRMSASEVKQEMKDTDGDPHTKARVRRIQREMSKRRMMQDVPKADVVVTNPTHFAVALLYETTPGKVSAPKVVAKGQDFVAQQIKQLARDSKVPIVENKPLARKLYKDVEVGQEIPGDMYEAVAQVLAFVYRTYGRKNNVPRRPRRSRATA